MKFETYMLRGLFIACFAACALILGAMLNPTAPAVQLASIGKLSVALLAVPTSCALPPDGVVCPRLGS